eukprot:TRINITY_DN387_c0_g1_i15.p1 TRINITY_DN387_c0_g1~~TRINITY_DN387_c0_g1_i15.p1  ORF type:complete len:218 (-),score=44.83 TRINITY_DN387_c0_g1_i15:139-792(-)
MKVHTGEKPFSCNICNHRFSDSGNMKRHMVVHTGEKPFSCKICNKQYKTSGSLKRHLRINHKRTKYKHYNCKICKEKFVDKSSAIIHIRAQHTESKSCDICKESYSSDRKLKRHLKSHEMSKVEDKSSFDKSNMVTGDIQTDSANEEDIQDENTKTDQNMEFCEEAKPGPSETKNRKSDDKVKKKMKGSAREGSKGANKNIAKPKKQEGYEMQCNIL